MGSTADAYHITAPAEEGEGAQRAMKAALDEARIDPKDLDYINAHGTSTEHNDITETQAIKKVFGARAMDGLVVSSTKSMIGHLLGAAGGIEAIATALTIYHGVIHPTINYQHPDPECDLDYCPNQAREMPVVTAISNSFGFGGHNVSIVMNKI